jgi:hypothetical protein
VPLENERTYAENLEQYQESTQPSRPIVVHPPGNRLQGICILEHRRPTLQRPKRRSRGATRRRQWRASFSFSQIFFLDSATRSHYTPGARTEETQYKYGPDRRSTSVQGESLSRVVGRRVNKIDDPGGSWRSVSVDNIVCSISRRFHRSIVGRDSRSAWRSESRRFIPQLVGTNQTKLAIMIRVGPHHNSISVTVGYV